MDGTKPWYQSQVILANIAVLIGLILSVFHIDFGATDQAALVQAVIELATGGAAIYAIIMRFLATKKIG